MADLQSFKKPQYPLNTLGLSHRFIAEYVNVGDCCIDATAGRGRDTAFLCGLVGETGKVLAFDVQPDAVAATKKLLAENGYQDRATVYLDSHENLKKYAADKSIKAIMFNLGWLPGGDHHIFSKPESTIAAIKAGLDLLCDGGVMSLCIYHGKETGTAEKDALLPFLKTLDNTRYTVLTVEFSNRSGEIPIPVMIIKQG